MAKAITSFETAIVLIRLPRFMAQQEPARLRE